MNRLERIARNAWRFSVGQVRESEHPFDTRDIHDALPARVKELFDNSHYAEATFEACKFLDNEVRRHAASGETGKKLMMAAFAETNPQVQLTPMSNVTERDEQEGYKFLFAGSVLAIRNPRGHQHSINDDAGTCLDHLSLLSHFLRRLEAAGFKPAK